MNILFETQTKYHQVKVIEDYPIRKLVFGNGPCAEQSGINLVNPQEHVFDFSLLAMHSLLLYPYPSSILIVGLGGGIIPMEMKKYVSDSIIDVIEIDPEVKKIAETYFLFKEDDRLKVYIGDAFNLMEKMSRKYDIIVLDAFFTNYIPFHLMSLEFFQMVYKILSKNGVVAVNMASCHPSFLSQIKTINSVFGNELYYLRGVRNIVSYMLFALKKPKKIIKLHGKPICHFLVTQPEKIVVTHEIKNAPILSLENFKSV